MDALEDLRDGALLLRQLRQLKPGQSFRIGRARLLGITVPTSMLDRQDAAFLVEWFRSRLPFYCTVRQDITTDAWDFDRPARSSNSRNDETRSAIGNALTDQATRDNTAAAAMKEEASAVHNQRRGQEPPFRAAARDPERAAARPKGDEKPDHQAALQASRSSDCSSA